MSEKDEKAFNPEDYEIRASIYTRLSVLKSTVEALEKDIHSEDKDFPMVVIYQTKNEELWFKTVY